MTTCTGHLEQFVVAGAHVADDPVDIDNVAAVNTGKAIIVEPRSNVSDSERAKQRVVAVEDVSVMHIGMNRDDIVHSNEMGAAEALDWKMTWKAPRRCTRATERRIDSTPEFGVVASGP